MKNITQQPLKLEWIDPIEMGEIPFGLNGLKCFHLLSDYSSCTIIWTSRPEHAGDIDPMAYWIGGASVAAHALVLQ